MVAPTNVQETVSREASDIEQRKVAMMDSAKALADTTNVNALNGKYLTPDYQVAGMSPDQLNALDLGRQGIGAYLPYMQNATNQYQMAGNNVQQGVNTLLGADTRNQFGAAQAAMNRAATPIAGMGQSAQLATQGVGLIGQGSADVDSAQADLRKYAQADLGASQDYLNQSVAQAQKAINQPGFTTATGSLDSAMGAARLGTPSDFANEQGIFGQGMDTSAGATARAIAATQQAGFKRGVDTLYTGAQQGQGAAQQGGFDQGIGQAYLAAEQAKLAAAQPGFNQATATLQQGIGALGGGAQRYDPSAAQGFMNPYQQQVIDESVRQINRQRDISGQNLQAQAARAGAFGGSREGIQRAELERGAAEQRNAAIVGALSSGYNTSQQQAQQTFEQQQQRQLAQAQGYQGAAGTQASIAAQQAGLGQTAAQQLAQAAQLEAGTSGTRASLGLQAAGLQQAAGQGDINAANMQGGLGMQAANQAQQQAQFQSSTAQQLANLKAIQQQQALAQAQTMSGIGSNQGSLAGTQGQLGLSAAQQTSNVGQTLGQQQLQQAQLGQSAANSAGQLGVQQAGLSGLYSNIAGQQANIYNQQAGAGMNMAQGIGSLAQQQFGIGQSIAQGLGSLGAQQGNLATQGAALGQAAQGMGQQDTNMLYNLGSTQQRQLQSELDASRQNELTKNMQPYQQLGFVSDIYRGAPTSQMAVTTQSQATPSPFMQAAGLGIGGVSAAAAAGRAGIL